MRTHSSLLLKPAHGWLVACVLASSFVLMGAYGDDVFAPHVGVSVSASGIPSKVADVDRPAAREGEAPARAARSLRPWPGRMIPGYDGWRRYLLLTGTGSLVGAWLRGGW
jgi:hypothetical protein